MQTKTTTDYFYESANNISFFFEENAFDDDRQLRQPKALSINKMGHGTPQVAIIKPHQVLCFLKKIPSVVAAMHDLDPVFMKWSRSAQAAELLEDLGYKKPTPVQSMYIFKVRLLQHHAQPALSKLHNVLKVYSTCSIEASTCLFVYTLFMLRSELAAVCTMRLGWCAATQYWW